MLEDLVLAFLPKSKDHRFGIPLLIALSQIFDVGTKCLTILPLSKLSSGIDFVWDVLLVLQLLMQSDLVDIDTSMTATASRPLSQVEPQYRYHFDSQALSCDDHNETSMNESLPSSLTQIFQGFSPLAEVFLPRVIESLTDNRVHSSHNQQNQNLLTDGFFGRRFQTFAVLYRRRDAIIDGVEFLASRIKVG